MRIRFLADHSSQLSKTPGIWRTQMLGDRHPIALPHSLFDFIFITLQDKLFSLSYSI